MVIFCLMAEKWWVQGAGVSIVWGPFFSTSPQEGSHQPFFFLANKAAILIPFNTDACKNGMRYLRLPFHVNLWISIAWESISSVFSGRDDQIFIPIRSSRKLLKRHQRIFVLISKLFSSRLSFQHGPQLVGGSSRHRWKCSSHCWKQLLELVSKTSSAIFKHVCCSPK